MIDALKDYYILFTIIFTFVFTFLQEKCIDKIMPYFSGPRSTKFSKWFNSLLYSYSRSSIESDTKWLRLLFITLIIVSSLCSFMISSTTDYFMPAIVFIFIVLTTPAMLEKTANQLFTISTFEIITIMILTIINIIYHKPNLLYFSEVQSEEEIFQYMLPIIEIILIVKVILFAIPFVITLLYKLSKIFTAILVRHDNPSKYIIKYILIAGSSYLLSIGSTMLIAWGESIASKAFMYVSFTFYPF